MDIDTIINSVYKDEIFELAKNRTEKIFFNSSSAHAMIVHQALMQYATQYVNIFASSLCSDISNNQQYCELVDNFLGNPDRKMKILLTNYSPDLTNLPLGKILKEHAGQVTIKSFDGRMTMQGKEIHFTFSDDRAFRLETDIQKHLAYGNFNAPKNVEVLKTSFDKAFESSLATPRCLA